MVEKQSHPCELGRATPLFLGSHNLDLEVEADKAQPPRRPQNAFNIKTEDSSWFSNRFESGRRKTRTNENVKTAPITTRSTMKDLLLGSLFVCLFMGYRLTDCYPSSQGKSMRVARSGRAGRSTLFPSIVEGTDRSDFDNQQF